jgi:hypothetical protein
LYTVGGSYSYASSIESQYVFTQISVTRQDTVSFTSYDPGSGQPTTISEIMQTPMVQVGSPPGSGQKGQYAYSLDNPGGHAHWYFSPDDVGAPMLITYTACFTSNGALVSTTGNPLSRLILAVFNGLQGQAPWGWLEQNVPNQVLGYSELAYAASPIMDLGTSGTLNSMNFEILGRCAAGGANQDCNPADIINDMLTNPLDGVLGWVTPQGTNAGYTLKSYSGSCNVSADGSTVTWVSGDPFTSLAVGMPFSIAGTQFFIATIPTPVGGASPTLTLTYPASQQSGAGWISVAVKSYSTLAGISSFLPAIGSNYGLQAFGGLCNVVSAGTSSVVTALGNTGIPSSLFVAGMVGSSVSINGVLYTVASYTDQFHLTLETYNGDCSTNGTAVQVLPGGGTFVNVAAGMHISIADVQFTVVSVTDVFNLTISSSADVQPFATWVVNAGTQTNVPWYTGSEVARYCAANGIYLSLAMDTAQDARQWINDLLDAANADCFWSEGMLKFRSYGDTTAVGGGYIYTPDTAPIYDLTDSELLCDSGDAPLKIKCKDIRDAENEISIEWTNRNASYALNTVVEQDFNAVTQYGRRPSATKAMHSICEQEVAELVAVTKARRSVYIDGGNQYEFTLPPHFCLLDPMDIVTLTDAYLRLNTHPVRIISIEEDDSMKLKVVAEEFTWSCSAPTLYPKQGHVPVQPGFFTDPGLVYQPMFVQLPSEITQGNEYVLGIAASGSQNWGGCDVYMATTEDGPYDTYVGHISVPSTMGVTTASLAVGADPDQVNTLSVNLTESYGTLVSYTQYQADSLDQLVVVDSELLAYETATFTSQHVYSLTYLRRGVYGTANVIHLSGAPFCVLDNGILRWEYPASVVGKTVWFKFCSVNPAGGQKQDLSIVTPFPCFIVGPRPAYPWSPGYVHPLPGDALYPAAAGMGGPGSFGIQPVYGAPDAQGNVPVAPAIYGIPPIVQFSTTVAPPVVNATIGTAGALPPGTYVVGVSAFDTASPYRNTDMSALCSVVIPPGAQLTTDTDNFAAGLQTFTPASMTGITAGIQIVLDAGASQETVWVKAVTGSTFTALTTKPHNGSATSFPIYAITGSIVLTVTWSAGSNGGDIYMAGPGAGGFHRQAGIAVGVTTATITAFDTTTEGGPDALANCFSIKWCQIIHGGPWAQQIQQITGTGTVIHIADPNNGMTLNQWAGYILTLWAKANPSNPADLSYPVPILNMPILSSTASAGGYFTLTIGPNIAGVQLQDLTATPLFLSQGDVVVMRSNPTFTASSFTDLNIANTYYPGGMSGIEVGHWAMMMTGPDAGDVQTVTSITGTNDTTINVTPWNVLPDAGDIVLILQPNFAPAVLTQPITASNKVPIVQAGVSGEIAQPTIANLTGGAWLFQVSVLDADGESAENPPMRELYFAGAQGTRVVTS